MWPSKLIPASGASFDRQRVRQHILYSCFFAIIGFEGNSLSKRSMDLQTIWVGDGLMNKKMSRVCALVLSLSFVLSSGCKKTNKDKRQRVVQESDPYYSCEEVLLDLEVPEAEGKELKYRGIFDSHIYADRVLILLNESYIVPEDLEKRWDNRILDPSLTTEDLEKLTEEYSSYQRSGIAVFDYSGKMVHSIHTSR